MPTHPIKPRDRLLLVIILFIAALLRLSEPSVVEFFHDDAMLSTLAQEMASGEKFYMTGILSSVGIPNPPISVYVMALPFALSSDPQIAILFIMLLNVAGVGLLWGIAHRYFGRSVALIAGLAYAFSPWAIFYSRKIWAQDFHTPFILLALLLGMIGFLENQTESASSPFWRTKKAWSQVFCLPVLLFGVQIHFAAWILLPVYFVFLWRARKRLLSVSLTLSAVLSLLILAPYMIGLKQTLDADPTRISDAASRSEASGGLAFSTDALQISLELISGTGMGRWIAPDQQADFATKLPFPAALWLLLVGLSLFGGLGLWRKYPLLRGMVLVWMALPVIVFTPLWTPVFPHYFIASIPAWMLLIGIGVNDLMEKVPYRKAAEWTLLIAVGGIFVSQGIWFRGLLRYLNATEIPYPGFTTPLHYLEPLQEALSSYDDIVVVSQGMWWLLHHEAAIWPVMLKETAECVRALKGDGYAVFPQGPFAVLIAPDAPQEGVRNIYETNNPEIFPLRGGASQYTLYTFENAPEWTQSPLQSIDPILFDSGIQLTGYSLKDGRITLEWRLPAQNKDLNYQYSAHFLDEAGERLGQQDTVFWHGRHWCEGDRLITWIDTPVPENTTILRISLYQLGVGRDAGSYFNANILDAAGNPAGQWIDIPVQPAGS